MYIYIRSTDLSTSREADDTVPWLAMMMWEREIAPMRIWNVGRRRFSPSEHVAPMAGMSDDRSARSAV